MMIINNQKPQNVDKTQSKVRQMQCYQVKHTPALVAAANYAGIKHQQAINLRQAKRPTSTPFTQFIQTGMVRKPAMKISQKTVVQSKIQSQARRYEPEVVTLVMTKPRIEQFASIDKHGGTMTATRSNHCDDETTSNVRRSVFTRMTTAKKDLKVRRVSISSPQQSRSQTMIRNKNSCTINKKFDMKDENSRMMKMQNASLVTVMHSTSRHDKSQPDSNFATKDAQSRNHQRMPVSVLQHRRSKYYMKTNMSAAAPNFDNQRFRVSQTILHLSNQSYAGVDRLNRTFGGQASTVIQSGHWSNNRNSQTIGQKKTSNVQKEVPLQQIVQPQQSLQQQIQQKGEDKSALTDFLYSMLSQDRCTLLSSDQKLKTLNSVSKPSTATAGSPSRTSHMNILSDNASVIRQLPARFYKGIIKAASLKRKRVHQGLMSVPVVDIVGQTFQPRRKSTLLVTSEPMDRPEMKVEEDDCQVERSESKIEQAPQNLMAKSQTIINDSSQKVKASSIKFSLPDYREETQCKSKDDNEQISLEKSKSLKTKQAEVAISHPVQRRNLNLKDLEKQFQQECDDLMGSISPRHDLDSGIVDSGTLNDNDSNCKITFSEIGSNKQLFSLESSRGRIPAAASQTFTQAWVQMPNFERNTNFQTGSQQIVVSREEDTINKAEVSVQGIKAPLQLRSRQLHTMPAQITNEQLKQSPELHVRQQDQSYQTNVAKALNRLTLQAQQQPQKYHTSKVRPKHFNISVKSLNRNQRFQYQPGLQTKLREHDLESIPIVYKAAKTTIMNDSLPTSPDFRARPREIEVIRQSSSPSPQPSPLPAKLNDAWQSRSRIMSPNKEPQTHSYWGGAGKKPQTGHGMRVPKINIADGLLYDRRTRSRV